jgi:hypothetical protein
VDGAQQVVECALLGICYAISTDSLPSCLTGQISAPDLNLWTGNIGNFLRDQMESWPGKGRTAGGVREARVESGVDVSTKGLTSQA